MYLRFGLETSCDYPAPTFRGRFTTTSTLVLHVGFPATKWREMASPSWAGGEIIYENRWMYNKGRCNKGNFGCIPVQCRTLHLHPTSIIVVFGTKGTYHYRMVLQVFCMFARISPHHDDDLPIPPTNGMR